MSTRVRELFFRLGQLVGSNTCFRVVEGQVLVEKCLEDTVKFLERILYVRHNGCDVECLLVCLDELIMYYDRVKKLEEIATRITSHIYAPGDAELTEKEADRSIKRLVRHISKMPEVAILDGFRVAIGEAIIRRLIRCIVEKCGRPCIDHIVKILITNYILGASDVYQIKTTLDALQRLCTTLNCSNETMNLLKTVREKLSEESHEESS